MEQTDSFILQIAMWILTLMLLAESIKSNEWLPLLLCLVPCTVGGIHAHNIDYTLLSYMWGGLLVLLFIWIVVSSLSMRRYMKQKGELNDTG